MLHIKHRVSLGAGKLSSFIKKLRNVIIKTLNGSASRESKSFLFSSATSLNCRYNKMKCKRGLDWIFGWKMLKQDRCKRAQEGIKSLMHF